MNDRQKLAAKLVKIENQMIHPAKIATAINSTGRVYYSLYEASHVSPSTNQSETNQVIKVRQRAAGLFVSHLSDDEVEALLEDAESEDFDTAFPTMSVIQKMKPPSGETGIVIDGYLMRANGRVFAHDPEKRWGTYLCAIPNGLDALGDYMLSKLLLLRHQSWEFADGIAAKHRLGRIWF